MRMIAYYPFRIDLHRPSASQLRPQRMAEGFRSLGYAVEVVSGYAKERKAKCRELRRRILGGEHFDFVYSEASTMPTLLTEKHHYPTHPWFDFSFFRFCKERGMRIGLFYRDVHWVFPEYYISGLRARVARWFYQYDLRQYNRILDRFYLPSMQMLDLIPFTPQMPVSPLPPGAEIHGLVEAGEVGSSARVRLLYVGGLSKLYDITLLLQSLLRVDRVELFLCCRAEEWSEVRAQYAPFLSDRIHIVHMHGDAVGDLYGKVDYSCVAFSPDAYNTFSIPYKLFESIGRGVPLVTYTFGEMGRLVQELGLGYACDYDESSLVEMLRGLQPPTWTMRQHVLEAAKGHSWLSRCRQVAADLA